MSHTITEKPSFPPTWPAWWVQAKEAAYARFLKTPTPTRKNQDWRFANVQALQIEAYQADLPINAAAREEILSRSKPGFETCGEAVFGNDQLLSLRTLPKELSERGVIWEPLEVAALRYPDLVQKYWMQKEIALGSEKFAALHAARCRSGTFLYLPKGIEIEKPLIAWHWLHGENASAFPHTLVVAEERSSATLVDWFASAREDEPGFSCGLNDLYLSEGASLTYVACQLYNDQTLNFQINSTEIGRDASARTLFAGFGGSLNRLENEGILAGQGARSEMLALSLADGKQEFDQRTLQRHAAPNTWSDLLFKNALAGWSKSIFKGLIRVEPDAAQTDAYQTNRNLLLSPNAEADSMPGLEILNDDVKCSHGAASGQLDEELLFYMRTRGLTIPIAQKLLAIGFLSDVLERLKHPQIAEAIQREIEARFARLKKDGEESISQQALLQEEVERSPEAAAMP